MTTSKISFIPALTVMAAALLGVVGAARPIDEKLPPPAALIDTPGAPLSPFEKRFRDDMGENESAARVEIDRAFELAPESTERFVFAPDLSAWPAAARSSARLWIAVGAPSSITTEGPLDLALEQSGVRKSTQLNYTYDMDGTMVLGSDYAAKDGRVILELSNHTVPRPVNCRVHVIVYVPRQGSERR